MQVFPGKDYIHQITLITDITGSPTPEDSAYIENEKALHYIQSLPFKPKVPLARLYPQATPMAIDLMEKIVQFNPAQRITGPGRRARLRGLGGSHSASP